MCVAQGDVRVWYCARIQSNYGEEGGSMQEEVGKGLRWNTKDGVTINHRAARTLADHRHPSLSTSRLLRLQLGGVQSRKWSAYMQMSISLVL